MKKLILFLLVLTLSTILTSALFGFNPLVFFAVVGVAGLVNGSHKNSYFATGYTITNINSDFVFKNAVNLIKKCITLPPGQNVEDQMLSQGTLRAETPLSTTQTNFHIPIVQNDPILGQQTTNTEHRLSLQDLFVATSISIQIASPASATDGAYQIFTYPTIQKFTAAQQAALLGFYSNAFFTLSMNNQVVVPYWGIYKHLYVHAQQFQTSPGYAANTQPVHDETSGATDGFYPIQPGWVFSGASNVNANIVLPSALADVPANSRIITIFEGILLQNLSGVR